MTRNAAAPSSTPLIVFPWWRQESLCIASGKLVWSLRVDCHVLDHGGNIVDACALAAIAALLSYRRPDVTISGDGGIEIHPLEEREPVSTLCCC